MLAILPLLTVRKVNIKWNKLQSVSEDTIITLSNAIIIQIPGFGDSSHAAASTASSLAMT
jgi:hypothetical protein